MTSFLRETALARILEHAHEAFVTVDGSGNITGWNPGAERLYGYVAAEIVGRPLEVLFVPREQPSLDSLVLELAEEAERRREWILRQRHKSGRQLRVALRLARLDPPNGRADGDTGDGPGLVLCAVDVTRLRRARVDRAATRAALEASRSELRRVAARLIAGEEETRRRVASELHDDFGQRLPALAFDLGSLCKGLPKGDPWSTELAALSARVTALAQDLRRLSHDLHPAALDRFGLIAALHDHCAEVEQRHGLPVRLSLRDCDAPWPPEIAAGLYRITQEALGNTVRYARARAVHVSLVARAGEARLSVTDDGVGFDPEAERHAGSLGLVSIEERARLLGGQCRIASAPGSGTEIEVTVPLPPPPDAASQTSSARGTPSERYIGPYRLLKTIGTGSIATVYVAEEPEPLGRKVALKLHRSPLPGRPETLRFKAEQQALARLHHPTIAEVYEARTTEEGDPYIVMEYVPGLPITDYCDRYSLGLVRRLQLFAEICEGVRHAHRRGVLHRHLAPANLLVMEEEGMARPKIIDFGLAKGLNRPLAEGTVWTVEEVAGHPAYVAPEALGSGEIDTRSDVYSLGAVLYELLVGTPPFEPPRGGTAALIEAACRGEPSPPSRRIASMEPGAAAQVARRRGFGRVSRLRRRLCGDFDRLALKSLAADPAARYPTVDALAEDVGRALRGDPVEAGSLGLLHQLGRLTRRHRRLAAAVALVILALAAGLITAALQARRAEREATRADAVARFLEGLFEAADPRNARGAPPGARKLLQRGAERLATELRDQPLVRARLLDTLGGIETELGLYDQARPLLDEALTLRERLRGHDHPEVAATLVRLGILAHLSGQGNAEALFRRALTLHEARLGADHPEVADVLNKLGATLAAHGRFEEAEGALHRALAIDERVWGKDDPRLSKMVHNLAGIAFYRGRTGEAERLLERALAIREKTLPEDDLDLAGSREALALLWLQQGRPKQAEALLERLAATAERVYGPDHPYLAKTLLNLGLARRDLGRAAEARDLFERALAINEKVLASDHPQLVRSLATLAELDLDQWRYQEAEPLYRRLVALHRQGVPYEGWEGVMAQWDRLLAALHSRDSRSKSQNAASTPMP